MEVSARPAVAGDLPELIRLAADVVEELRPHRGGDLWHRTIGRRQPIEAGLRADLDEPTTGVVVGTIDDVPVGYGVVHVDTLRDGSTLGTITDLYTEAPARGVGVGEAMMDLVLAHAGDHGCIGVDSVALPGDRHTKNFFESFGLVARAITVHRAIDS